MFGLTFVVLFVGTMIADAIMFVNGYKSWIYFAKTQQEKAVRRAWFKERCIVWDEKT